MSTWAFQAKLEGYRISPAFNIASFGDGAISKISWNETVPINSSLKVETSLSFDEGYTWSAFKEVANGSSIPDISSSTDLSNARIRYKVFMTTSDANVTPILHDLSGDFSPVIEFYNDGDVVLKPELWIEKIGLGDAKIINITNNSQEFSFTGLIDGETVYVHCEREQIETSLEQTYRYGDFNDNYLELLRGVNVLQIVGDCKVNFRYRFKTLQG